MRPDLWPGRTVEAVDTKRQRLYDDPDLGNLDPGAPAPTNVHEVQAKEATERLAQASQSDEGPVLYWATLRLRNGKLLDRTTRRSVVAAGWHRETALTVVQHGTGTPPWETEAEAIHDAPPVVIVGEGDAPDAHAAMGTTCLTPRDTKASDAAALGAAAPAQVGTTSTLPAAGAGVPDASPNLDALFDEWERSEDLRLARCAKDLRRYIDERARGCYLAPRFRRSHQKPF